MVVQQKSKLQNSHCKAVDNLTRPSVELDEIPYTDFPELKIDEHERTEMPFRYVRDDEGNPVMPPVSSGKEVPNSVTIDFI